jgi:hypothetical protein
MTGCNDRKVSTMQDIVFDGMARELGAGATRRSFLRLWAGAAVLGAVAALRRGESAAAKRKGRKKHYRRKQQRAMVPPPPPAEMPATCSDGVKNGSESDVDCGGPTCARCALGRGCVGAADCSTSHCVNNVCKACQGGSACPTGCTCNANTGACVNLTPVQAATCVDCPRYSFCTQTSPTTASCFPPCA